MSYSSKDLLFYERDREHPSLFRIFTTCGHVMVNGHKTTIFCFCYVFSRVLLCVHENLTNAKDRLYLKKENL